MIRGWDAPHKRNPHFINFLAGVRSVHFVVIFSGLGGDEGTFSVCRWFSRFAALFMDG